MLGGGTHSWEGARAWGREDLALQLQQKEKDLLLAAGSARCFWNATGTRSCSGSWTRKPSMLGREEVSWRQRAGELSGGQGAGTRPGAEGREVGQGLPLEQQSRARTSLPGSVAQ